MIHRQSRIANLFRLALPLIRLARDYAFAHIATKLLAAISGLLLVRILTVQEYGFYTVLLAAFTFICTVSDMGATETLAFFRRRSRGQRSWRHYLGAVIRFRRIAFFLGISMASVYLFYTGRQLGQSVGVMIPAVALVGLGAWFAIRTAILTYLLKLEQQFHRVYIIGLGNEGVKLLGVALIWILGFTTALGGISGIAFGAFCAALLAAYFYEPGVAKTPGGSARTARRSDRLLRGQILPIMPGTVYFSLQGPLIAWIALEYGSVVTVAEVGALARINVLIAVVAGFIATVVIPRLLVISDEKLFYTRYLGWWIVLAVTGVLIIVTVSALSTPILYLLGDSYAGLHNELVISATTAVVATWGSYSWGINRVRGWTKYQLMRVPVMLAGQISLFLLMDLSTAGDVLLFALGSTVLDVAFQTLISILGFSSRGRLMGRTG